MKGKQKTKTPKAAQAGDVVVVQQAPLNAASPEKVTPANKDHSQSKKSAFGNNTGAIIVNTEERKGKDTDGMEIKDAKKLIGSSQAKGNTLGLQKQCSIRPQAPHVDAANGDKKNAVESVEVGHLIVGQTPSFQP